MDNHLSVIIQGWTREWDKCLEYRTVCASCCQLYKEYGIMFENEELAMKWLNEPEEK